MTLVSAFPSLPSLPLSPSLSLSPSLTATLVPMTFRLYVSVTDTVPHSVALNFAQALRLCLVQALRIIVPVCSETHDQCLETID